MQALKAFFGSSCFYSHYQPVVLYLDSLHSCNVRVKGPVVLIQLLKHQDSVLFSLICRIYAYVGPTNKAM